MPTIEEIINSISTVLHPTPFGQLPPSVTYKGVKIPHWEYFVSRPSHPSDRLDSALSSANGILNFILSPVRDFVGAVLHPLFSLLDSAYDLVSDFVQSVFGRAVDLAYSAADTISAGVEWAVGLAQGLVNDARTALNAAIQFSNFLLNQAIDAVRNEARSLYNLAAVTAQQLANAALGAARAAISDAGSFLGGLIDGVRRDAVAWFNDAKNLAAQGLADLRQWAAATVAVVRDFAARAVADLRGWAETAIRDAIGAAEAALRAVERDVIAPLVHDLESFLAGEWKAAKALLGILEDAVDWIVFVTTHVAPVVRAMSDEVGELARLSPDEMVQAGAGYVARLIP